MSRDIRRWSWGESKRGDYLQASRQTMGEFAVEWWATIAPTIRPSTLDKYRRDLRAHAIRHIGFMPLTELVSGVASEAFTAERDGVRR